MAGRIRSIKPELLDDEKACALSDEAWRLWVSTWVLADDYGNCRAGDRYLASLVWQDSTRSPRVAASLGELRRAALVHLYTVEGQNYLHITGWAKNQRIDNAGKPRVPGPDMADQGVSDNLAENLGEPPRVAESLGFLPLDHRSPITDHRPTTADLRPPRADRRAAPLLAASVASDAARVLEALNAARTAAIPGSRPLRPTAENTRHIAERLAAGATVDDCLHVIAVRAAEVRVNRDCAKWFDAVTPFRADGFAKSLASTVATASRRPNTEPATKPPIVYSTPASQDARREELYRLADEERAKAAAAKGQA